MYPGRTGLSRKLPQRTGPLALSAVQFHRKKKAWLHCLEAMPFGLRQSLLGRLASFAQRWADRDTVTRGCAVELHLDGCFLRIYSYNYIS